MGENKESNFYSFIELFILFMVILVIIQTFLEDFSIYAGMPLDWVKKIRLLAFFFDLFFTFEFITRLLDSITKGKGFFYFFYENGWIDFLSSIPLLLLLSAPEFILEVKRVDLYSLFADYSADFWAFLSIDLSIFKILKAVKIVRIFRLIRILKIFGKIKISGSVTEKHQIRVISTTVIITIILFFLTLNIFQEYGWFKKEDNKVIDDELTLNRLIVNSYNYNNEVNFPDILSNLLKNNNNIIQIFINSKIVYEVNESKKKFMKYYSEKNSDYVAKYDYELPVSQNMSIYYSRFLIKKSEAFYNLTIFSLLIFVLLSIVVIYKNIFKSSITDPIYVMRMGFNKIDYIYNVKIKKYQESDDIFLLSEDYNNKWLPAKMRKINELKEDNSKFKITDAIKDFKESK